MMFIIFLKYCYFWASKFFFRVPLKTLKVMILPMPKGQVRKKVSVEPCLMVTKATNNLQHQKPVQDNGALKPMV